MSGSVLFNRAMEQMVASYDWRPDYYVSVKRRTWRTLWLVRRTYREPRWNPITISLDTGSRS